MPCYTVRTVTVELEAANEAVLIQGLKAAGFRVVQSPDGLLVTKGGRGARIASGRIILDERDRSLIPEIKRAYAAEAVRSAARRYGWHVTQDRTDAAHLTIHRRA